MLPRLLSTLALGLGAALLPAQVVVPVTTLADAVPTGPAGSLRAAIQTVLASPAGNYVIEFTVPVGTIALAGDLQSLSGGRAVTIRRAAGGARLVLDATGFAGVGGLVFNGAGSRLEVPTTLRINSGLGLAVNAANCFVQDLEIQGGTVQGLVANAVSGLTVRRLVVTGGTGAQRLTTGVLAVNCTNLSFAAGPGDPPVEVRNCTSDGIAVLGGANVTFGSVLCDGNFRGVSVASAAAAPTGVVVGAATAPRSVVQNCGSHGISLTNLSNGGAAVLTNLDVRDNAGVGVFAVGCTGMQMSALASDRNLLGAIILDSNTQNVQVGPGVSTTGRAAAHTPGIVVRHASGITLDSCVSGPDHTIGIQVSRAGSTGLPTNVVLNGCRAFGGDVGLSVSWATGVTLAACTIENNATIGLEVVGAAAQPTSNVTVTGSLIRSNGTFGLTARTVGGLVFGGATPGSGNTVDFSGGEGCFVSDCAGVQMLGNTVGHSGGYALNLQSSNNALVGGGQFVANGNGIFLVTSNGVTLRDFAIEDTMGTGLDIVGTAALPLANVTVTGVAVRRSFDFGIAARRVNGLVLGPGNVVQDSLFQGCFVDFCPGMQFAGNQVDGNRGFGLQVGNSPNCTIRDSSFQANRGISLWLVESSNGCTVGPLVVIANAQGSGITLESCGGCFLHACRVDACSADGITFLADGRAGLAANRLQSCFVSGCQTGLVQRHAPPVTAELCTIAGNLRGVRAEQGYQGGNATVTVRSSILWNNVYEDYSTAATLGQVIIDSSFFRVPAPTGTNRGLLPGQDPGFVNPAVRDYRLSGASSPAFNASAAGIAIAPGAVDAIGNPRVNSLIPDCGAFEYPVPGGGPIVPMLVVSSAPMPAGGDTRPFQLQYPVADAGALSALLLQFGPPAGSFVVLGALVPLVPGPELLLLVNDPSQPGALSLIPPSGAVSGQLAWAGRIPLAIRDQDFTLCGVSLTVAPQILNVTNASTVRVQ